MYLSLHDAPTGHAACEGRRARLRFESAWLCRPAADGNRRLTAGAYPVTGGPGPTGERELHPWGTRAGGCGSVTLGSVRSGDGAGMHTPRPIAGRRTW